MITNYSVGGFKVFSDRTNFKLAPITLIYGPNSSGKSSIIQSLIVLKESLLNSNVLKSNNSFFELGGYLSVVHNHEPKNKICFEIDVDDTIYEFEYAYSVDHNISYLNSCIVKNKENNTVDLTFSAKNVSKQGVNFFSIDYEDDFSKKLIKKNNFINDVKKFLDERKPIAENEINKYLKKTTFTRKNNILPSRISRIDNNLKDYLKDDEILRVTNMFYQEITTELSRFINNKDRKLFNLLNNLSYIGPLRPHPKRVYQLDGGVSNSVGQNGENFLSFLILEEDYINKVNDFLESFNINYKIEVVRSNDAVVGDMASILLRHKKTNIQTTLVDVGFGIGQLLPILIEGRLCCTKI